MKRKELAVIDPSKIPASCGILEAVDVSPAVTDEQKMWILLGEVKQATTTAGLSRAMVAETLSRLKATKSYKAIGFTWEEFVFKHTNLSVDTADRLIADWKEFGRGFFNVQAIIDITREAYRLANPAETEDGEIKIGDQRYPVRKEFASQISAAFELQADRVRDASAQLAEAKRVTKEARTQRDAARKAEDKALGELDEIRNKPFANCTEARNKLLKAQSEIYKAVTLIRAVMNNEEATPEEYTEARGVAHLGIKVLMEATATTDEELFAAQCVPGRDLLAEYLVEQAKTKAESKKVQ